MTWSLNEIVVDLSRVQCELCCEDFQARVQTTGKIIEKHDAQTSFAC